ncbi:MAG: RNA polymerase sigma factor [Vicinamibacterales bacterium]
MTRAPDRAGAPPPDAYADLVRQAAAGDDAAMERLLVQAQEVAWRFSLAVCGRPDDAEDAMQEALLKTYRHTAQIRDPQAFRPWLHRTVRNACLMSRRKRRHEPRRLESLDAPAGPGATLPPEPPDPGHDPEQAAANARLRTELKRALQTLPPPSRAVLFLREMQGLSTREVAHAMGMSEDTVKTRLSRARKALQAELQAPYQQVIGAPLPAAVRQRARRRARAVLAPAPATTPATARPPVAPRRRR